MWAASYGMTATAKFLIEELKRREANPAKASVLFSDAEVDAVFKMSDLMQVGTITPDQAKKAMGSMV